MDKFDRFLEELNGGDEPQVVDYSNNPALVEWAMAQATVIACMQTLSQAWGAIDHVVEMQMQGKLIAPPWVHELQRAFEIAGEEGRFGDERQ